jgi:hypothetical protein
LKKEKESGARAFFEGNGNLPYIPADKIPIQYGLVVWIKFFVGGLRSRKMLPSYRARFVYVVQPCHVNPVMTLTLFAFGNSNAFAPFNGRFR